MIVAKTKLKKLPSSCKDCKFKENEYNWYGSYECCVHSAICYLTEKKCPIKKKESGNTGYADRPKWCPLEEVHDDCIKD